MKAVKAESAPAHIHIFIHIYIKSFTLAISFPKFSPFPRPLYIDIFLFIIYFNYKIYYLFYYIILYIYIHFLFYVIPGQELLQRLVFFLQNKSTKNLFLIYIHFIHTGISGFSFTFYYLIFYLSV
jgi:hypothetical protein